MYRSFIYNRLCVVYTEVAPYVRFCELYIHIYTRIVSYVPML
jgi:hypothetical protein